MKPTILKETSNEKLSNSDIETSKKYSIKDAASVNCTVGFGDNYVSAYGIAMNANSSQVGMLTSIPNLIAPLAGLFTYKTMEKFSRKKIFSLAILIQSLLWIPMILISLIFINGGNYAPALLVLFYTIYAFFGSLASPAWASWIGDLVKPKEAGRFFGLRNKIGGITVLVSMILGGIILDLFKKESALSGKIYFTFIGFSLIFFLALSFRLLSRYFVLKQHEPKFKIEKGTYFSFWDFLKRIPKSNYGKFSVFIALIVLTTNIAGPFYAIYILRDLNFSYTFLMLINISGALAPFFFMTKWGEFSDKYGNILTIKITSYLIPLVCFLWPVSILIPMPYKLYFLLLANFFSGFAWAGFNLAAGNFVYDVATSQKRGLCIAYSSILNGVGVILGTTLGSVIISNLNISFINIIMFVSIVSGIARYLVVLIFTNNIKEVREIEKIPNWKVIPFASEIYNTHLMLIRGVPVHIKNLKHRIYMIKDKVF